MIIEAILVDDGLRYKQLSVGIKAKNGDIIRIIPISTMLDVKKGRVVSNCPVFFYLALPSTATSTATPSSFIFSLIRLYTSGNLAYLSQKWKQKEIKDG
ncbi:MAG: hypothetical protein ACLTKQ_08610 [Acutalibacteraceae bacterium]